MPRSVVTGVAGFVGSHLAEHLIAIDLGPVLEGADYVFHQAALSPVTGTAINIGGGSRIVLRDVLDVPQEAVGQRAQPVYRAHQKGDVGPTAPASRRAQRLLGFVPAVDISELRSERTG